MFANWAAPNTTLPPDVILELGPPPCPTRYAAHAALIAIHSGYLRAALRTVDNNNSIVPTDSFRRGLQSGLIAGTNAVLNCLTNSPNATTIYLPNVTAEQFSPLLAYMYTGCLELTAANIFGVLLATHLLHMPRALELCRSFLSSSTISPSSHVPAALVPYTLDSHLSSNCFEQNTLALASSTDALDRPKLVRPIASKATTTEGLSFIAPPMASQINLMPSAPFRSLEQVINVTDTRNTTADSESPSQSPISVTQCDDDLDPIRSPIAKPMEDIHIYPLKNQTSESETTYSKSCANRQNNAIAGDNDFKNVDHTVQSSTTETTAIMKPLPLQRKRSITNVTPETADDRDNSAAGVIVDIASCDGPVRFRRVLNIMYDCNKSNTPNRITAISSADSEDGLSDGGVKRIDDQRYTSLRQQVQDQDSFKSTVGSDCLNQEPRFQTKMKQKIASPAHMHRSSDLKDENNQEEGISSHHSNTLTESSQTSGLTATLPTNEPTESFPKVKDIHRRVPRSSFDNSSTSRRDAKPLDMNVQYYPCKTCGSKFPSYYFVHKHRKLCHTEEENDTADSMTSMNKESGTKTISKEDSDH
uniref:Uncharacterized protein n=1 Tax=Anopheles albimanus TaxID=7167 RepID=A0A182FLT8_ANOAL